MIRKDLIIAVLLTFCLTVTLFTILSTMAQVPEYDIWLDFNDDGKIDMRDIGVVARAFGANGQPINKTFVLLQLQAAVTELQGDFEAKLPDHNVITIGAAAFTPQLGYGDVPIHAYGQLGYRIGNLTGAEDPISFFAPVQLPHGVNITRLYAFWFDYGVQSITTELVMHNSTGGPYHMADCSSPGKDLPGRGSSNTNLISPWFSVVDSHYQYYLRVTLPPPEAPGYSYYFYYAMIEYEYPE